MLSILSSPFASHYNEIVYITWHNKAIFYQIDERVKVLSAEEQCGSKSILKRILWLRNYNKRERPDALVSFSAPFNMIALISLKGISRKIIISERNDPDSFRWGKIAKLIRNILYLNAAGIIVQTKSSKDHLWGPLAERVIIIPNPILMNSEMVGCAIKTEKKHIIVTASRLVPQKRHDLIIKSFSEFQKSHPDYHLIIYGDGKERKNLLIQISALNLENNVHLPGTVSDIWDRIKCAEMFVMASDYEGMSNSLLEAMILGLPCISTRVSGAVDIIEHEKNGWLIDINDEAGLVKAMMILADNEKLRREIGINATKEYDSLRVEDVSIRWIDYIDSIISK